MTTTTSHAIQVAGVCGSLRKESFTRKALRVALEGAEEAGASTRLVDLCQYELVFCDGKEDESRYPQDVSRLRQEIRAAQGIILATPEYHGGYSGVLKNALDLMGFEEFEGKMLALVGVSGGALGAAGALSSLREIGRALHAWVVPEQASVAHALERLPRGWNAQGRGAGEAAQGRRGPGGALRTPAPGRLGGRVPEELGESAGEPRRRVSSPTGFAGGQRSSATRVGFGAVTRRGEAPHATTVDADDAPGPSPEGGATPRRRRWSSAMAAASSPSPNSCQGVSRKHSSACAHSHSRKSASRRSPPVWISRSTSGPRRPAGSRSVTSITRRTSVRTVLSCRCSSKDPV
jgi:NAD(P)H-dependent FMN reductase